MPHTETVIDGVFYPSVTQILAVKPSPWLQAWKDKWGILAERKMKLANAIGTEFHRCVDSLLRTGSFLVAPPAIDGIWVPSVVQRVKGMMESFQTWAVSVDGEISFTELKLVSRRYRYSGTLDAVGTMNGKPMIYDWKTSSRIYDDMQLQLAAYAYAYNEQYVEQPSKLVKRGLIVHVSKDKPHFKLTVKEFRLGKRPFKEFLKLKEMVDASQA